MGSRPASPTDGHRPGPVAVSAVVAGVVVTAVRFVLTADRREYAIWPDEPAQLAIARYVGGGARWTMEDHSVWRPLFGVVISPVHWFSHDPVTVLRSALAANALFGGIAAGLLVLVLLRLTPLRPRLAGVTAVIASMSPAVLFTTEFVWSESITLALYLAALLALLRFLEQPVAATGVTAGVVAGTAFAAHSRMLPVALVVVAAAIGMVVTGRAARRAAAVTVGATVVAVLVAVVATEWIVARLWNSPSNRNSVRGVIEQLGDPGAIAVAALGQTWHLLVASLGMVAFGTWALVAGAIGRRRAAGTDADGRLAAGVVLVVAAACVALSMVFMADRWRSDQLVYGRYNAVAVVPIVAVGIGAWLDRPRPSGRVVALAVLGALGSGALLWALRRDELAASNGLEPMILGLQPFIRGESIPVVAITTVAALLTGVLGALSVRGRTPWWPTLGVALLVVLIAVGGVRTTRNLDTGWSDAGGAAWYGEVADDRLAVGSTVDWYLPSGSTSTQQLMLAQFHAPSIEFRVVTDPLDGAIGSHVFAPIDLPVLLDSTARLVAVDTGRSIGLWRR